MLNKHTHHAAGVGLAHGVGVAEGEACVLCGGGLAERLEEAGSLWLGLLTKKSAAASGTKTAGWSWTEDKHTALSL